MMYNLSVCDKVAEICLINPSNLMYYCLNGNKRAQRALGRSPEEKVKGHSGANNREPQGHNLNNFGRGPFDESSGPCSFRQEGFRKFHFKNLFIDPVTYLCNQLEWFEQL